MLVYLDDLLSLYVVCHIAILIQAAVEVTSASLDGGSPGNQDVEDLGALHEDLEEVDVALDDGHIPVREVLDILKEEFVPGEVGD